MGSGFFSRLKKGLSRSTKKIEGGVTGIFSRKKLDQEALDELEELLITADLGASTSAKIIESFKKKRFSQKVTPQEVREALAQSIVPFLTPVAQKFTPDEQHQPYVVLVVGVNGTGKTTTIGKMAYDFHQSGKKVTLVAGDTFRAAAVEQLQIWGQRAQSPVVSGGPGADAAGLAFDGIERAKKDGSNLVFIDTAGRLHNRQSLMDELAKIVRVIKKCEPTAPHSVLLVLDATTGQNAVEQVRVFRDMVDVSGLIITKLDGTAKGGIVVSLAAQFGLPVYGVGVGESIEDLQPFNAQDFAYSLVGAQQDSTEENN